MTNPRDRWHADGVWVLGSFSSAYLTNWEGDETFLPIVLDYGDQGSGYVHIQKRRRAVDLHVKPWAPEPSTSIPWFVWHTCQQALKVYEQTSNKFLLVRQAKPVAELVVVLDPTRTFMRVITIMPFVRPASGDFLGTIKATQPAPKKPWPTFVCSNISTPAPAAPPADVVATVDERPSPVITVKKRRRIAPLAEN